MLAKRLVAVDLYGCRAGRPDIGRPAGRRGRQVNLPVLASELQVPVRSWQSQVINRGSSRCMVMALTWALETSWQRANIEGYMGWSPAARTGQGARRAGLARDGHRATGAGAGCAAPHIPPS